MHDSVTSEQVPPGPCTDGFITHRPGGPSQLVSLHYLHAFTPRLRIIPRGTVDLLPVLRLVIFSALLLSFLRNTPAPTLCLGALIPAGAGLRARIGYLGPALRAGSLRVAPRRSASHLAAAGPCGPRLARRRASRPRWSRTPGGRGDAGHVTSAPRFISRALGGPDAGTVRSRCRDDGGMRRSCAAQTPGRGRDVLSKRDLVSEPSHASHSVYRPWANWQVAAGAEEARR